MIRKDLPKCPFCGSDAKSWEWNGGARVGCSAWNGNDGEEHYVGVGGRTLEEAEKKWCERFALSDDAEKMYRKHYEQGRIDERVAAEGGLMQTFDPD